MERVRGDFWLCDEGRGLYMRWSELLDQRRPKAGAAEIREAERGYIDHRRNCQTCTPLFDTQYNNEMQ